jgi:hypothetical protein
MRPRKGDPENISVVMARRMSHPLMSLLNSDPQNIRYISVTPETFHLLISPLNWDPLNISLILVTLVDQIRDWYNSVDQIEDLYEFYKFLGQIPSRILCRLKRNSFY